MNTRPLRQRTAAMAEALQRRPGLLTVAALAIAVGVAFAMGVLAGPTAIRRVLAHPHPAWIGVLVAGQAVAYLGYAIAHHGMSALRHGPSLPLELAAKVVAVGFGPFALGGGFAVDRRALIGLGASPRTATTRVLALGSLEYAALAPAAMAAAVYMLLYAHVEDALTLPWVICVPLGFLLGLWLAGRRERLCRSSHRAVITLGHGLEGLSLLRRMLVRPWQNGLAWLGIGLYWAGDIASLWAGLRMFGVQIGAGQLVLAYATGYALTPRSLPLAGVGVTEALMPVALTWVGLHLAPAVVGVAAYRIVGLLISVPLAAVAMRDVEKLSARATKATAAAQAAAVQPASVAE